MDFSPLNNKETRKEFARLAKQYNRKVRRKNLTAKIKNAPDEYTANVYRVKAVKIKTVPHERRAERQPGAHLLSNGVAPKLTRIAAGLKEDPAKLVQAAVELASLPENMHPGRKFKVKADLAAQYGVAEDTLKIVMSRRLGIIDDMPEIRKKIAAHKLAMSAMVDGKVHERLDELDEMGLKEVVQIGKSLTDQAVSLQRDAANVHAPAPAQLNIGDVQALNVFLNGDMLKGRIADVVTVDADVQPD